MAMKELILQVFHCEFEVMCRLLVLSSLDSEHVDLLFSFVEGLLLVFHLSDHFVELLLDH